MKTTEPLVSVAITTYKRPSNIVERALKSVVEQTYGSIEIFLINDWPEDKKLVSELEELCKKYSDKREIHYVVVEKNGGACRARNIALRNSKGRFFACLDDDDEWLPKKIELQVEAAQKNNCIALVYCNVLRKYDDTSKVKKKFNEQQPEGNIFGYILGENKIGSCSFPLIDRSALEEIGGFDEKMPALQDWEMYLRILRNNKAAYVQEECAVYHRHQGERISANPENRIRAYEIIHKKYSEDFKADKNAAASFYLAGAYFYSVGGNAKKAFYYYWRGAVSKPSDFRKNIKDLLRTIWHLIFGAKYV